MANAPCFPGVGVCGDRCISRIGDEEGAVSDPVEHFDAQYHIRDI